MPRLDYWNSCVKHEPATSSPRRSQDYPGTHPHVRRGVGFLGGIRKGDDGALEPVRRGQVLFELEGFALRAAHCFHEVHYSEVHSEVLGPARLQC